jgi:transcriptional regulator with XRE-family HTH domain
MTPQTLGRRISEIRNQKGMTQKELSEACNIDIRTIQRIEADEVVPRMSTLKLLATALEIEWDELSTIEEKPLLKSVSKELLLVCLLAGIINWLVWILYGPFLPKTVFLMSIWLPLAFLNVLTGVVYYYGFYHLASVRANTVLKISIVVILICIPLFLISMLLQDGNSWAGHLNKLIIFILGVNNFLLGSGFLKSQIRFQTLYKMAALLLFASAPFLMIPVGIFPIIGSWVALFAQVPELLILYKEQKVIPS